jgi:hypothetical protein
MFVPMLSVPVNHEHRDMTVFEDYQSSLPPALDRSASKTAHGSTPYSENLRAGGKRVSGSVECRSAAVWLFVLHILIKLSTD